MDEEEDKSIGVRWAMVGHESIIYIIEQCCEGDVAQAARLIRKYRRGGPRDWRYTDERIQEATAHFQAKQAAAIIDRLRRR